MPKRSRLRRKLFPKKTKRLEKQMAITIPSTKEFDKPLTKPEMQKRIKEVRDFFTEKFHGTTRIRGIGSYEGEQGIVDEDVVVVEAFADAPDWQKMKTDVAKFVLDKRKEWSQESVAYELEGDMYLVKS